MTLKEDRDALDGQCCNKCGKKFHWGKCENNGGRMLDATIEVCRERVAKLEEENSSMATDGGNLLKQVMKLEADNARIRKALEEIESLLGIQIRMV